MVAEAAALRLGSTVATAAARLWLGGRRREQERHLSMDELVRTKVGGLRLQREVRNQFEQITDAVFDRLEPYLDHEFRRLEESSREAVVDAVCDTLAAADLSDDAILAADAKPAELTRRITSAARPPVGLGEAESRLHAVLFAECVEYYVHVVRSLPVFEERAAAELLERTTTLGREVAQLLRRLPDRSLLAPEGTDQDTAFRRRYLELVSSQLDEIELFRSSPGRTEASRVRLSVAYVSLRASGDDGRGGGRRRSLPLLRPDMSQWDPGAEDSGAGAGMHMETALGGATRVLLRGEAGCGKTTLLRRLAVTAARGAFTGDLAAWNGLTPVFVKLREYSGRALPRPEEMLDGVAAPITGIMPRGWVERQLDSGNALLLIDGVDELLDRERRRVRDWLRTLLAAYDRVHVVVTSRPAAATADWLAEEDFTHLQVDRMTPPDLAAFVRQWHRAVRELGGALPCPVEELPQYEQSLLTSLMDRPHLQSLAGTPLLAAMLCSMHLNRGRRLPRDRMELYRNALHTLVHDRDAERNVPSAVDGRLSLGDKLILLRDLAWRLSDNNRTEIDVARAAGYVDARLRAMRHLDPMDGTQVLDHLRDRSGLLRAPALDRLDFVHRTFQEYLAAEEAAEEDRIGNLVGRAHLDVWRETIVMAAGHANRGQREELINGILDRAETEPRHARALRLLAAACRETMPTVSDALAARLESAVDLLLPPRRKTDPPALAAVGPSLLRRMPTSLEGLSDAAAVQTVRTVGLIGGEEGLRLLEGYAAQDARSAVVGELITVWRYFEAHRYVDRVLAGLPLENHHVSLAHAGQVTAARRLPRLRRIDVTFPLHDLRELGDRPALNWLGFVGLRGEIDLAPLAAYPALDALLLWSPTSFRGAHALDRLQHLEYMGMPAEAISSLGGSSVFSRLRNLYVLSNDPGSDLSPLSACTELGLLSLSSVEDGDRLPIPAGGGLLAAMSRLSTLRCAFADVSDWLGTTPLPPRLQRLELDRCTLPENASALLDLPGVDVTIT
ncbi:NACHT domain-containing protein [Streptomyces sp. NPDC047130]|uniref:NACHT domain-containing protein n=1 Tax=Streptomyces sp. NPDC047130 TaxID=3155261 RepID=UPI0033C6EE7D